MNPVALLSAAFAGFLASVLWCVVAYVSGFDLPPFSALVVGGIVGFGAVSLDGSGSLMGICCALVTVVSVFAGKAGGVYISISEVKGELLSQLTVERYDAMKIHAPALVTLPSPEYYRDFMVENGYASGDEISDEELERFEAVEVPVLRQLDTMDLRIGEWKDLYTEKYLDYSVSSHSVMGIVFAELGFFDLLFGTLGAAATFSMVLAAGEGRRRGPPGRQRRGGRGRSTGRPGTR